MRVVVVALGTRGDFELFHTLSRALVRRGHRVVLGSSDFHSSRLRDHRIEWVTLGAGSLSDVVSVLRSLAPVRDRTKRTYEYYTRWLKPQVSASLHGITAIGAGGDYFVSNLKLTLRRDGQTVPGAFVTYDPPLSLEDLPKYGSRQHGGRVLELVAMPKRLADPGDRWGSDYRFTGFWTGEPAADGAPSPELARFVEAGAPPVVVTMGSMVMFDAERLARDVAEALCLSGQRGIIVGGWSGLANPGPEGPLYRVSEAPYEWLFPRASCVVHHGGCGTVAAVLRAGKPSILLPQIACQEHFGQMLLREGLATGMFEAAVLRPSELAAAIGRAVTDEHVKRSAREWGELVARERGVDAAVDLIEAHWGQMRA